jgi:hypothetical protein
MTAGEETGGAVEWVMPGEAPYGSVETAGGAEEGGGHTRATSPGRAHRAIGPGTGG